jgi:hypothetical protein
MVLYGHTVYSSGRLAAASPRFAVRLHRISLFSNPTLEIHMNHKGSCHCGRVAFEVEGTIDGAVSCNCSMCQRKGSLLWFVPHDQLRLLTPDENASTYLFNKHLIKHRFCPTCGVHPYAEGTDPRGNRMAAINVRCLEGIDLTSVPVTHFDGRSM